MSITLELKELISLILLLVLGYLVFRMIEMKWSYKISKPYKWDEEVKAGNISKSLQKIERTYRDKVRFYSIWLQIERLKDENIPGDFAELGVYAGETARFIKEMDPARKLHLFDTFDGFDKKDLSVENSTDPKYSEDNFSDTTLEEVKEFIGHSENINYYPGYFPESTEDLNVEKFAFVHLDADLYKPTLAGLEFFYPRLSPGAVIIIHDYNHNWEGARKAVDEFTAGIPEVPTPVADWQGSVMIIKNS